MSKDKPDLKIFNFKASPELGKMMDKAIKETPRYGSKSELIRDAIFSKLTKEIFETDISSVEDYERVIDQLASLLNIHENKMAERIGPIHTQLVQIHYILKNRSSEQENEIMNYLGMITDRLFGDKRLDQVLQIKNAAKLIPLLEFDFHADYLGNWIDLLENTGLLTKRLGRIIWNEKEIRNRYDNN